MYQLIGMTEMASIKIDPRPARERVARICEQLRAEPSTCEGIIDNYAYEAGYLQEVLVNALYEMPVGKRQKFLSALERQVQPKTRKVVSLITGTELEIAYDTPMCCDPSTETYWSM